MCTGVRCGAYIVGGAKRTFPPPPSPLHRGCDAVKGGMASVDTGLAVWRK